MATLIGKEPDLADNLRDLMELDYDAVSAYQAAIDRLKNPSYKTTMRAFLFDHIRHITELRPVVLALGVQPPEGADAKALLTTGKVLLGQIVGDRGILRAMRSNEEDTNTAYERTLLRGDLTAGLSEILQRGLADERRHRTWFEDILRSPHPQEPPVPPHARPML